MEIPKELKNKIFFDKYKIIKNLGKGSFNNVYLLKSIKDNKLYAAKLEERISSTGDLEKEAYFLYTLKNFGIPELITYGHSGKYNILILQLLGKSLKQLFSENTYKIKDLCMSAIQIIDRIKFIHSKYIIHRDIKPENFLIGNPDSSTIYIIDFGLSRKYRSSRTGKHIEYFINKKVPGTIRYLSLNASLGIEQTRRDDLESIAYMLIYLGKGSLPWNHIKVKNEIELSVKTYKLKKFLKLENLCVGLPNELISYIKYVRKLKFDEEPDYNYLKNLFITSLKKLNELNDLCFFWINSDDKIFGKLKPFSMNDVKFKKQKRKSSSRKRLLKKVEESLLNNGKLKKNYSENNINFNVQKYNKENQISKTEHENNGICVKNKNDLNSSKIYQEQTPILTKNKTNYLPDKNNSMFNVKFEKIKPINIDKNQNKFPKNLVNSICLKSLKTQKLISRYQINKNKNNNKINKTQINTPIFKKIVRFSLITNNNDNNYITINTSPKISASKNSQIPISKKYTPLMQRKFIQNNRNRSLISNSFLSNNSWITQKHPREMNLDYIHNIKIKNNDYEYYERNISPNIKFMSNKETLTQSFNLKKNTYLSVINKNISNKSQKYEINYSTLPVQYASSSYNKFNTYHSVLKNDTKGSP